MSERRNNGGGRQSAATEMDRLPQHDIESEQGVLGCCLLDPAESLRRLAEKKLAEPQMFYDLRHQTIFNVLWQMYGEEKGIDIITVQERLKQRGLPTGLPGNYLDKVLTGIRETHFVTLAARPGGGKSALALNIVEYLAEHHVWYQPTGKRVTNEDGAEVEEMVKRTGMPVAVFSIEMDNESLGYRLMFGRAGVSEAKFNQGFAEKGDAEKLVKAAHELSKLNIFLDDTPAQTIGQIAAKARRMAKQHGIKLFVLDYLQLAESDDPRDEARVRVNKISKKIMALKKQLKVPWLVLAQLNRNIETAERDRNPVLSDLAESGAIEQDSDKVIILKNTPRRELEQEKDGTDGTKVTDKDILQRVCGDWEWSRRPKRVDAWVVKNRRGPTGKAEMVFQGNLCKFEDWHLFKVKHGVEGRKEGESKHMGETPAEQSDFDAVVAGQ